MNGAGLIKVEIPLDGLLVILIFKEVDPLEHVGLLDKAGSKDSIP